jgi:two-component system, chemotaxis family, chemotaxis protein CheY
MARILVIDDSKMFRMLASAPLTEAGHTVQAVDPLSIYEVLKALYAFNPDLVLTDYWMPNCNGETLVQVIREDPNFHNVKILVCSSHGEESLVERMGQLHINGYILKGKGMQSLVERVEQLVD